MNLDMVIISIFCMIDDLFKQLGRRIRGRGFAPGLTDAEAVTIETVGELIGLDTDKSIFEYFRRHYSEWFPALRKMHRTTFVRQSANLSSIKEWLWQRLLPPEQASPFSIVDSFPVSVCRFVRATSARLFHSLAAYGKDHGGKATIFGFRFHVRISSEGWIRRLAVAPANVSDTAMLPQLVEKTQGCCLGDRNYWQPDLKTEFKDQVLEICAPFRMRSTDPMPERSRIISRHRQLIETVFSQLRERFNIKRVWARDTWHLANRVIRKVLAHTLGLKLNLTRHVSPLQLAKLFAY